MNVVDSSGWLEYFADGPNAEQCRIPMADSIILATARVMARPFGRKMNIPNTSMAFNTSQSRHRANILAIDLILANLLIAVRDTIWQ